MGKDRMITGTLLSITTGTYTYGKLTRPKWTLTLRQPDNTEVSIDCYLQSLVYRANQLINKPVQIAEANGKEKWAMFIFPGE